MTTNKLNIFALMRRVAKHPDPLIEANNWRALVVGTHLPFWPLYIWWAAGNQAWPTSILTIVFTPLFLIVPPLSKNHPLAARVTMILASTANTVFTTWVLGQNTGTELFYIPCAIVAALSFRKSERWLMVFFSAFPTLLWYAIRTRMPLPLHFYDAGSAGNLFILNALSVALLVVVFGWLQLDVYARMEQVSGTGARP